jgi:hypothetical protein
MPIVKWLHPKFAHHLCIVPCEVIPSILRHIICWCTTFFAGLCVVLMQMLVSQLGALPSSLMPNKIVIRRMHYIVWNNPI